MFKRIADYMSISAAWPIFAAVAVLAFLGIVSVWADTNMDGSSDGPKQIRFLVIALMCMVAFQVVNYQSIGRFVWVFYIGSLLLVLYTVAGAAIGGTNPIPFVSRVNGAYNWIKFGSFSLQPAELTKIAFVLLLARYLRWRSDYRRLGGLFAPFLLAGVPMVLILKQPDLGTALTFIPPLLAMLYMAGAKLRHMFGILGMGVLMVPVAWVMGPAESGAPGLPILKHFPALVKPLHRDRVHAMFSNDPATLQKTGYQIRLAHAAMGSGGVVGKGFGQIPVGERVPEAHNDMVFALIGEQFGFFGSAVVLVAYIVLFTTGIEIAAATQEPFGRLIAVGIVAMLAGQTFINLFVVTGLMPVTGVTLPFISYGGSSLLASCMAIGLLLNVAKNRPIVLHKEAFEFGRR